MRRRKEISRPTPQFVNRDSIETIVIRSYRDHIDHWDHHLRPVVRITYIILKHLIMIVASWCHEVIDCTLLIGFEFASALSRLGVEFV